MDKPIELKDFFVVNSSNSENSISFNSDQSCMHGQPAFSLNIKFGYQNTREKSSFLTLLDYV